MANSNIPRVAVIGCGVSGLSSAIFLLRKYQVTIIARELPPDTTSNKAAAIWFPYKAGPENKVAKWARFAYDHYQELCNEPKSGVSMVTLLKLGDPEQDDWWHRVIPPNNVKVVSAQDSHLSSAYSKVEVPFIDTSIYMRYLVQLFSELGGKLEHRSVEALAPLIDEYDMVVNCSGLGAMELCKDPLLYPISGHIAVIDKIPDLPFLTTETSPTDLVYVFPRSNDCILGGTAEKDCDSIDVNPNTISEIMERCASFIPRLQGVTPIQTYVGIRPGRDQIRLERDSKFPIIHNYGHGGSGFTVSWGCADAVFRLAQSNLGSN